MKQLPLETIRQAVSCGEYDRARILWEQCAAGLAEELSRGCLAEGRLAEVRELVDWSRTVVLCERTRVLNKLNHLHVAGEYEVATPTCAPRLVSASF